MVFYVVMWFVALTGYYDRVLNFPEAGKEYHIAAVKVEAFQGRWAMRDSDTVSPWGCSDLPAFSISPTMQRFEDNFKPVLSRNFRN